MNIDTLKLVETRLIRSLEDPCIRIPKKLIKAVNYLSADHLMKIHGDPAVAKERCLYFCSFLQDTYLIDEIQVVRLNAKIVKKLLGSKYTQIIQILKAGTEKGPIIECAQHYRVGEKSRSYWFAEAYSKKRCAGGLVCHKLKTPTVKEQFIKNLHMLMMRDKDNIIINNLLHIYQFVGLPTNELLIEKGKKLIAEQKTSKKGKIYKFLSDDLAGLTKSQIENISFIEHGIRRFSLLTKGGFIPPRSQGSRAGHRISDTFTNMHSWIREEVTLNGQRVEECDFKCLHPNLAISIYGGSNKYLTHKRVAEYCGIDTENTAALAKFKTDHLAFFNKRVEQMKRSTALYDFYQTHEREMLGRIEAEKESTRGHTVTSANLFAKEVEIMTRTIKKLNAQGIYVLYVFDALLCEPKHKPLVETEMNQVALECGVCTATRDMNIVDRDSCEPSQIAPNRMRNEECAEATLALSA